MNSAPLHPSADLSATATLAPNHGRTALVVFRLEAQRFAVPLAAVERIVRAVAVTVLPRAPALVLGVIDVAGRVLPVLDLRRRLGLPERTLGLPDHFVLARTARRTVALVVDEVEGVVAIPAAKIVDAVEIVPGLGSVQGVVTLPDGLVLIYDLESFLSLEETEALEAALRREVSDGR